MSPDWLDKTNQEVRKPSRASSGACVSLCDLYKGCDAWPTAKVGRSCPSPSRTPTKANLPQSHKAPPPPPHTALCSLQNPRGVNKKKGSYFFLNLSGNSCHPAAVGIRELSSVGAAVCACAHFLINMHLLATSSGRLCHSGSLQRLQFSHLLSLSRQSRCCRFTPTACVRTCVCACVCIIRSQPRFCSQAFSRCHRNETNISGTAPASGCSCIT